MNVDRYITDEAAHAAWQVWDSLDADEPFDVRDFIRAALPFILAAHRADVLREESTKLGEVVRQQLHLPDEAVGE